MTRRQITRRTVARVIAIGVFAAVIAATANVVAAASGNLAQNPGLENGTGVQPDCWLLGGYGSNSYSWSRTGDAHSGSYSERLTISSLSSGDRKLLTGFATGCSPAAAADHTYTISVWYKSDVPVALFAFTRKTGAAVNSYEWWHQGSAPASSNWSLATWTTPSMPSGIAQISMGLGLQRAGTVTMDDFSVVDNEANPTPTDTIAPGSSIQCNNSPCSSSSYSSSVSVSLAANDSGGSGVSVIRYTTDGTAPTLSNGVDYTTPFTVSQTTTVQYRAYDNAGNVENVQSQQVAINTDTVAPASSIQCNNSPCSSSSYSSSVSVSLAANDSGGSGVSVIRYTTDGTAPTLSNGVDYTTPFTVSQTTTVQYRAYDNAGNVENVQSQQVAINTSPAPPPPASPPPPDNSASGTLPSGAPGLPSTDSSCAGQVFQSTWEPVPANNLANNSVPPSGSAVPWSNVGIPPSFTKWYVKRAQVDGNYTGTTDEIIQWGACKWGIDPDLMRAVAVQESDWKMSEVGDYCGTPGEGSYGLFQVKNAMCDGTGAWGGYPYTAEDTALNADFYGAALRACLDGDFRGWLYRGQSIAQIISAKGFDYAMWGCVGAWFSGDWYDSGASSYISSVKSHLAKRDWLNEGP